MKKIYAKEINYAPAVGDFELYLASEVDARIAELEQREELLRSQLYSMYVRAGYAQHEAHELAFGPSS